MSLLKSTHCAIESQISQTLENLRQDCNYRALIAQKHEGFQIFKSANVSNVSSDQTNPNAKWLLNLASNDYLGLASDESFNESFLDSALFKESLIFSSSSSRLLSGNFEIYTRLESHLSRIFGKQALLFNSGFHANLGALGALNALKNVLFVADKSIHASHIDGLKSFKPVNLKRFPHNDIVSLRQIVQKNAHQYDAIFILSEGLFSMEGDFAPLQEMVALKKAFNNVYLYLDEAHSIGSFGEGGLGLCADLGLLESVDFLVLTFGKALASMGACVLCDSVFCEYFINFSRSLIYSTALPPLNVARSLFGFLELPNLTQQRIALAKLSADFKALLAQHLDLEISGDYNIVSLILGENAKAVYFAKALEQEGYFAPAIKSPTTPKNRALLRFSLTANLPFERLESLVFALKKIHYASLSSMQ
ncbi:aminotransferase class I/II-fold pyridoxal phosphate-dependent enzyme [Helicobacter sp. MIT 05-5294]|uniref:aminotransferase class I/II-fold pyridoxal phosphate-dependent enzyme n=1 Tax=Helicobacter sp. MIT 05-5294 TaxID=1548150 RepID=UPI0010FDAC02|nr:aminotransferase class I/II-fold pyridoxal phosphate-dependent enzyme [Helicobacter sp. MIT 05-5294]TLD87309.1 aminotransferase class I/II-fold pyridoxal phosphate-dependent enzyme [Helicobacter sp. MIT 05-5294]